MPNQIQMSPTLAESWRRMQREFKQKQKGWQAQTLFSLISALTSKMEQKNNQKGLQFKRKSGFVLLRSDQDWAKKRGLEFVF